jgi:cytochrome oxidase Cu insertion factor (SCO1/SenC/PrrC family)
VVCVLPTRKEPALNEDGNRDEPRSLPRLVFLLIAVGAVTGIGLGTVAYLAVGGRGESGLGLPALHGQASWSPAEKRAPAFRLRDHDGALVSLEELRDRPVLLTFLDSACAQQCPIMGRQLGTMLRSMPPGDRPALLIVSVNPTGDSPANIRHAMASWRLSGPWRWHWLRGTKPELAAVWRAYGMTVEAGTNDITHGLALYLIDRRGFERTGYLFPFLPNLVELDLRSLGRERT